MRFLARLLGSTSDPALRHLETLPVVVARLAAAQQETNRLLAKLLDEAEAGTDATERGNVQAITTNALLGRLERALTNAPRGLNRDVSAAPSHPASGPLAGEPDTATTDAARASPHSQGADAPAFAASVLDESATGAGPADLETSPQGPDRGHDRVPCSSGDAQQPEPKPAPEAPAATSTSYVVGGPYDGQAGTELPPPPASEEPATSLPGKGTQARKVYEALVAIAEEGGDWPGQAAVARRVGLPSNVIGGNIGQLRRIGAIIFVPSDGTPDIKIAATGKIVRRSAPPAAPAPTAEVVPIRPAPPAAAHVDAKPVIPDGPRAYLPPEEHRRAAEVLRARGHKVIPMSGGRFFHNGETIDGAELVRRANEAGAA